MIRRIVPFGLVLLLFLCAPRRALACWDGWAASLGDVEVMAAGDSDWSPATAREFARWSARIQALLPAGASFTSEHGTVTITTADGSMLEGHWDGERLESLFDLATRLLAVRDASAAKSRDRTAFTVQLFAAHDRKAADAFAAKLEKRADNAPRSFGLDASFYSAGGFPSVHPMAHVIEERDEQGQPIFRVLAGAFAEKSAAESARVGIGEVLGTPGFVRAL